eukprot:766570-Hanusia_phi.AAC.2
MVALRPFTCSHGRIISEPRRARATTSPVPSTLTACSEGEAHVERRRRRIGRGAGVGEEEELTTASRYDDVKVEKLPSPLKPILISPNVYILFYQQSS